METGSDVMSVFVALVVSILSLVPSSGVGGLTSLFVNVLKLFGLKDGAGGVLVLVINFALYCVLYVLTRIATPGAEQAVSVIQQLNTLAPYIVAFLASLFVSTFTHKKTVQLVPKFSHDSAKASN